ncbi:MAG: hypothetical protein LC685_04260 [Actinobacteria bacterium]|nr:hypothetical protein [Actinomycetota bacterium]
MTGTEQGARGSPDAPVTVRNLTARRIEVARIEGQGSGLIVPPFGDRTLTCEQAARYDLESWKSQRLVDDGQRREEAAGKEREAVFAKLSGYCLLATLTVAVAASLTRRVLPFGAVMLGLGLTALFARMTRWQADAWRSMARSFNIFLGMAMAFGATAAAILLNYPDLRHPGDQPDVGLAVVILWLFIAMASVMPAALFLFFHRQKVPTLRANFLHDVVRLDPNVQTTEDAESRYDVLIRDVYGSGDGATTPGRRLPILAATGVITGLWIWAMVPGLANATNIRGVLIPEPDIVTFAFLGSYVFAINMLFRRYARADLGPKAYTHIIVRIFAAIVAVWVLSFAPFARADDGSPHALMLLLAFFVGIVPETGTAIVADVLQQWKPVAKAIPSLGEDHPLSRLEGISLYDRAQFLEVGIENIESLAHHDIVELMLWTRIPTARLVDFVDQAILYLHMRGPVGPTVTDGDDQHGARTLLVRYGIRTATDLERAYCEASKRSPDEARQLMALVDLPGATVHRLQVVVDAMEDDEWMVCVRNWRDQSSAGPPVTSVEEFVALASLGVGPPRPPGPPGPPGGGVGPARAAGRARIPSPRWTSPPRRCWPGRAPPRARSSSATAWCRWSR